MDVTYKIILFVQCMADNSSSPHDDDESQHSDDNSSSNSSNNAPHSTTPHVTSVPPTSVPPVTSVPPTSVPLSTTTIPTHNTNIVDFTLNQTINGQGTVVTNQQGTNAEGIEITHTTLNTTDITSDIQVDQNLIGAVTDVVHQNNTASGLLLDEIKVYAGKIQCTDFHGKGTIDDYTVLFESASRIANETKQMQLNIDVEGFTEFGKAADDLSQLFTSFIVKLQTVSIIDDTAFLASILDALKKIFNLSEVFGRFKETIMATATIQMPTSAHNAKVIIEGLVDELSCAMNYINYFVSADGAAPVGSQLNTTEQAIINTAVTTIDSWNALCEQGVSISLENNPDVQYIKQANANLNAKTAALKTATASLKAKLARFNINQ